MTEREKMALGLWYDANFDPELCAQRDEAAARCLAFNNADPRDAAEKARLQKLLLPRPPFRPTTAITAASAPAPISTAAPT